ncbi:MAG TPA: arylesterase [Vicinamibacterales bacterium]|nr:arylesterase [Vicinamibacterales bacterium]
MLRIPRCVVLIAVATAPVACTQPEPSAASAVEQTPSRAVTPASRAVEPPRATSSDAASAIPRIVILGDSLTAGYGLDRPQSYPALLQKHLDEAGYRYEVVNAGVSGDTSAGGLRRLDWSLEGNVRVLILELGANDGLRGLPVNEMKKNLGEIVTRAKSRGIRVILAGMEAPPNYGPQYSIAFHRAFRDLSTEHKVALIPFLLEGVAGDRALNIADGIHPNPEGARILERNVWRTLQPLLDPPRP